MLSSKALATIKATVPVLEAHGETLTRHFYKRMFSHNPEVKEFFNPAHQNSGTQQRALAGAILAYAANIDNLAALGPAVELIAQKHVSLMIKPEHYPIVGNNLINAIKEVLGDGATKEVIDAWTQAYGLLADILIKREAQIYDSHMQEHGWVGPKKFTVVKKERESSVITSFYLKPADGMKLRPHKAGQYISVRVPGTWFPTTMRNYSLSSGPGGDMYRISVKREQKADGPLGCVSGYLHDKVKVGDEVEVLPPCGEFTIDLAGAGPGPLVFVAGGIGATPLLSMLHKALKEKADRKIYFIQGANCENTHAFQQELSALAKENPRLKLHTRYTEQGKKKPDSQGLLDTELVKSFVGTKDAEFFFCGPDVFMKKLYNGLLDWGVEEKRIHFEFFGPLQSMREKKAEAAS